MKKYFLILMLILLVVSNTSNLAMANTGLEITSSVAPSIEIPPPPSPDELREINAAVTRMATGSGTNTDRDILKLHNVQVQYQDPPPTNIQQTSGLSKKGVETELGVQLPLNSASFPIFPMWLWIISLCVILNSIFIFILLFKKKSEIQ